MSSPVDNLGNRVLPFGKHRGKTFDQVPLDYLDWLVGEDWLKAGLRGLIKAYLEIPAVARELEEILENKSRSRRA